jgi:predicted small lipoprotein YifL
MKKLFFLTLTFIVAFVFMATGCGKKADPRLVPPDKTPYDQRSEG